MDHTQNVIQQLAIEIANDKVTIAELKAQIDELKAKESEQNEID
ncbi:hypothetical protein ABHA96_01315 [Ligilactobacillus ruminis]|nr:hypothetical protein [Ligilactobacillus ruminis]